MTEEDMQLNNGILIGLDMAIKECDLVDLIGADECIERIRSLMQKQNEVINENHNI